MYDNDYYLRTTDDDALAAMTEMPADKVHSGERDIKMWKAVMTVSKKSHPRPTFSPNIKECLATFVKVGGQEAWTLWDSGSTTTGIMLSFVDVAKITVFLLKNPMSYSWELWVVVPPSTLACMSMLQCMDCHNRNM